MEGLFPEETVRPARRAGAGDDAAADPSQLGAQRPAPQQPVARVALDTRVPHLDRLFDYLVPEHLHEQARPGTRVRVVFNHREQAAWLIERTEQSEVERRELEPVREMISPLPVLTPEVWELVQAVAARSAGLNSDVLRLAVPPRAATVERAWLKAGRVGAEAAKHETSEETGETAENAESAENAEPSANAEPADSAQPADPAQPAQPAALSPEIIVLLTDGANTRGVTPSQAAAQAAERGVRVYPIGFGTKNPTQMVCSRDQLGTDTGPQGYGGFGGRLADSGLPNYLVVDEDALRTVARATRAEYFAATDADQLNTVLRDLPRHVTVQQQDVDLSAGFAAIAALLLVTGLGLSIRWTTL